LKIFDTKDQGRMQPETDNISLLYSFFLLLKHGIFGRNCHSPSWRKRSLHAPFLCLCEIKTWNKFEDTGLVPAAQL